MDLVRAIYSSWARDRLPFWQVVSEVLAASERRNRADGLTGILVSHDGVFLQALEGRRAAVSRVLLRIATDPRHTDMEMIEFAAAPSRLFADWSMAHVALTPDLAPVMRGLPGGALRPETLTGETALELLTGAAASRARAA